MPSVSLTNPIDSYTQTALRKSNLIKTAAWGALVAGVAIPLMRRRLNIPRPVAGAVAAAPAFALCVATPRSKWRDVGVCGLQMYWYLTVFKMPNDDPESLKQRAHVSYPLKIDQIIGIGTLPTVRLQHLLSTPGKIHGLDRLWIWTHWLWFIVPHGSVLYILWRHPQHLSRAAAMIYATFDLGAVSYWSIPTAPPWFAAQRGLTDGELPTLRRMMIEYGAQLWGHRWDRLYAFFGGNPLAAMPSLHFATSLMAAHMLSEVSPIAGSISWSYALTLGIALVYLGEHYVVDLIAGFLLAQGVRRFEPKARPALCRITQTVKRLEMKAGGSGVKAVD